MTTVAYHEQMALEIMTRHGLANAGAIYTAAAAAGLNLPPACALIEKESGGRNVYGHDPGGTLSGFPGEVNRGNFEVFWWLVKDRGQPSNGVGPAQLTFPGFFTDMLNRDQQPWHPSHNAQYGFELLLGYHTAAVKAKDPHPWVTAGSRYNGALVYGIDLHAKIQVWRDELAPAKV